MDIRTFQKGKNSEYCEDSIAYDMPRGRYAVADGVTSSTHSDIVAKYLVDLFVNSDIDTESWPTTLRDVYAQELYDKWQDFYQAKKESLNAFARTLEERRLKNNGPGASTFCGVKFDPFSHALRYALIGDCCLYILPEEGNWMGISSNVSVDESGTQRIIFSSLTNSVVAGAVDRLPLENWLTGEVAVEGGYLAIMSDGVAEWMQSRLIDDSNAGDILWDMLDDSEALSEYIDNERQHGGSLCDDISIIMIRLADDVQPQTDAMPPAAPVSIIPMSLVENIKTLFTFKSADKIVTPPPFVGFPDEDKDEGIIIFNIDD